MENQTPQSLALQVIELAQSRILADLRFLSAATERLKPVALDEPGGPLFETEGSALYFTPQTVLLSFRAQQKKPARALLHLLLHCILGHPFQKQPKNEGLWDLACDLCVEQVIAQLDDAAYGMPEDGQRSQWLFRLAENCPHMTAQELYNYLLDAPFDSETLRTLAALFAQDSHRLWYAPAGRRPARTGAKVPPDAEMQPDDSEEEDTDEQILLARQDDETEQKLMRRQKERLRREWKQLARQAESDLKTFSRRHGARAGALMDSLAPITFEECDYSEFLRRFGAQNEVMQLSDEEFDLIYYTYGLRRYGNVPLVEPLEYRDDKRVREFVIVIDTSGSVQGEIVQSFLQRTCDVLRQSGSFTQRVNIYLIQCDAEVQSVEKITSIDQLHELIPRLRLRGFGGTDFRPAFDYVDGLLKSRALTELNGLLYFTDGVGTYPEKAPAYKTAFIFNRDDYISPSVPSWAIRAVMTTDSIRVLNHSEEEN